MEKDIIERACEIVNENTGVTTHCVLSLIDLDGCPTASTITAAKADGITNIFFCTGFGTKTERINKCNRASVCFNSEEYNITLKGTIEIATAPDIKAKMWYEGLKNHFSGADDAGYCVLCFKTTHYNLLVDWKEARGAL